MAVLPSKISRAKENNKAKKVIAIFIAYNASKTLEKFYREFPKNLVDDIILVDDCSKDGTFELAKKLGIKSYQNPVNLGYGGNLKRAISLALEAGADIIIDIHPDGEYKTNAISSAIKKIRNEGAVLVLGKRWDTVSDLVKHGMRVWKIPPLLAMSFIHELVLRTKITDLHQGFRVYTRKLFENVLFEECSNNYLFSFEIIVQACFNKFSIQEVPVQTQYVGKKRGASLKSSIIYSLGTFKVLLLYIIAKLRLPVKIFKVPSTDFKDRIFKIVGARDKK